MTTVRIEKQYIDNLINYVEKLESHAGYVENKNRVLSDKIEHLEKKISNIKRNKLRLKNKYNDLVVQTSKHSNLENNTEEDVTVKDELDWIEIDEMSE